jgi:hypothetical protein
LPGAARALGGGCSSGSGASGGAAGGAQAAGGNPPAGGNLGGGGTRAGGGIIKEGDTFYMHGEYFLDLGADGSAATAERTARPPSQGRAPHIIKCPGTGEFVLYAHAASADYQTDKELVCATSPTVNGDPGGAESPTVFKAGNAYYWIGSYKTGWRANNNCYSTAPAITGSWTYQGFIAPVTDTSTVTPSGQPNPPEWISDERTWLSQSTWVTPVVGCSGTVYVFRGDHGYGNQDTSNPAKHNDQATYVFQPLVLDATKISMPTYLSTLKLDVSCGTWSKQPRRVGEEDAST